MTLSGFTTFGFAPPIFFDKSTSADIHMLQGMCTCIIVHTLKSEVWLGQRLGSRIGQGTYIYPEIPIPCNTYIYLKKLNQPRVSMHFPLDIPPRMTRSTIS